MSIYVFGYGSLISKLSAERALKRELAATDFFSVEVKGYIRTWRAKERLFFEKLNREADGLFLDLLESPKEKVNGVLIKVTEKELEQVKIREKNYKCIEIEQDDLVLNSIVPDSVSTIITFVSKPEHQLQQKDKDVYLPQAYIQLVESACLEFGQDFLQQYKLSTKESECELVEGKYTFVDPTQAQFV